MKFHPKNSVEALNAGLFVSPGYGRHPDRIIDSHEIIFVKSGVLGLWEEGRDFALKAGEAILLEEGLPHGGSLDYAKELQFYWLHFRLRSKAGAGLELPKTVILKRPERMTELFRIFLDDQESGKTVQARADALVELLLLEMLEEGRTRTATETEERLVASAENLLKARHRDPAFGASALAKELKCNPDYLNRVFRRLTGATLTAALRRIRVNSAAQLLLDGVSNVEEAALQSGFSDRSYMRRVFKELKGMTPKKYRLIHLRMHINTR